MGPWTYTMSKFEYVSLSGNTQQIGFFLLSQSAFIWLASSHARYMNAHSAYRRFFML
jgi:hypothetical protein